MNLLVAVADYPDNNGNVKLMYVHTRNIYYKKTGIDVTVLNFAAKNCYNYEIEMDGGINEATSKLAAASGADILVSGNAVFKADDPKEMIAKMHLAKK